MPPLLMFNAPVPVLSVRMYVLAVPTPPVNGLPVMLIAPVPPLPKFSEPIRNGLARSLFAL